MDGSVLEEKSSFKKLRLTFSSKLELLDKLQKRLCRTVGPSLAISLEFLGHHRNVASLSLFYRYYFGRYSSGLAQIVPLPYSWERSTRYSDTLHDFSVTIPRCYSDVCQQFPCYNSYNPGQNIWCKVKRYSKIGQDLKT